jgi:hypothetical protein
MRRVALAVVLAALAAAPATAQKEPDFCAEMLEHLSVITDGLAEARAHEQRFADMVTALGAGSAHERTLRLAAEANVSSLDATLSPAVDSLAAAVSLLGAHCR